MTEMQRLDALIADGWGDTPQCDIPEAVMQRYAGRHEDMAAIARKRPQEATEAGKRNKWPSGPLRSPWGSLKRARIERESARMRAENGRHPGSGRARWAS